MDFKNRRVAIGYPSSDFIEAQFQTAMSDMMIQSMNQGIQIGQINAISSVIANNRCKIVEYARSMDVTDILWMDTDTIAPVSGLVRLLSHDKDIVCATTCSRSPLIVNKVPIAVPEDQSSIQPYQKLVPMKLVGFPFMLTRMSVFDELDKKFGERAKPYFACPPRWMTPDIDTSEFEVVGEDEYFCTLVRKAGFKIWCDMELSMEIGHIGTTINYIQQPQGNTQPAKGIDLDLSISRSDSTTPKSGTELLCNIDFGAEAIHRSKDGIGE